MKTEVISSLFVRFLLVLVNFASVRIFIEGMGIESYGIWTSWIAIVSWLSVLEISIGHAFKNYGTKVLLEQGRKVLISEFRCIFFASFLVFFALSITSFFIFLFIDTSRSNYITIASVFLPLFFVASSFSLTNSLFFVLDKAFMSYVQQLLTAVLMISFFSVISFAWPNVTVDFSLLGLLYGVSIIFSYLPGFFLLKRFSGGAIIVKPDLGFRVLFSLSKPILGFVSVQIVYVSLFVVDRIIIGIVGGGVSVVSYDLPARIFSLIVIAFSVYTSVFWTKLTAASYKKDLRYVSSFYYMSILGAISLTLIFMAVVVNIEEVLVVWTGSSSYHQVDIISYILLFSAFIQIVGSIASVILNANGYTKVQSIVSVVSVGIKVLSLILLLEFSNLSVPVAVAISTTLALLIWTAYSPFVLMSKGLLHQVDLKRGS